ncbi:MAG TPA: prephenate dehydrogenase/arogenate dehydrogenase family protein [Thermoplasmata archaeon]|nr:prephenate dehydrogenase/arogenate dehydrogenase family protein [Thermoplasmata archaeon]
MTRELAELRRAIREVDRELQRAVTRRLELARAIGRAKQAAGQPVRDYEIEREVLERWRAELVARGVAAGRSEELARWMIEEAVRVQDELGEGRPTTSDPTDILIVGGAGQMGAWMAGFLESMGHRVGVVDPRASATSAGPFRVHSDLLRAAQDADVIVVATPMRVARSIYRELEKSESEAVVFDILSIKAPIVRAIHRRRERHRPVGSVHPLFGPGARSLSGRNLLVLDCGDPASLERIVALFAPSSLAITTVPLDAHDRIMADVLALPHAVSLLFGTALGGGGRAPAPLGRLAPTSFLRQAQAARVVAAENPELSFDIQTLNPEMGRLYRRIEAAVRELREAVEAGDANRYGRLVSTARDHLEAVGPG